MQSVYLNSRLTLQQVQRVADGAGGYHDTWGALGVVWAAIDARSQGVPALVRITVRAASVGHAHRPKPDQRFVDGTRSYVIVSVTESDSHGHYLTCQAREEVSL
ncbi:head-tail adaptor protein [Celeribacter marinus]|uniref:head-tail adaptor protein n=1 Tax=Celeribacter marinus TaxID=1397108 RepID=UPI0031714F0A